MPRILLLGGTTEASLLARALAGAGVEAVFSYAGRTAAPVAQPLPTRVGGFGGVAGLVDFLRAGGISHVVDATHPFAAQMTRNAVAACAIAGVPLLGFERPAWTAGEGDDWLAVPDLAGAVAALPATPARVFLAIGKQHLAAFAAKAQHIYLLRLVDVPGDVPLPRSEVVVARGPFTVEGDTALMQSHRITHVVAKNAGGSGARAKLDAARALRLPVILIDRPQVPPRPVAGSVAEVMVWLGHARLGV
ncbi:cobalt-precorrin-6A reductase [Fertoebacter nigrum]|uniref:Cobalt-precorrin-6A reductase n=1 Tax=Fertoeibacter niger TaxID=2656921 RepID=A0A8X8HAH6_9RHOB|nr:cobalt-precorrin-6A reductase [Fertoeibacter niger]NUB46771.1 cobalt-precorrin-6A reductase [Fertoeibacter niger]